MRDEEMAAVLRGKGWRVEKPPEGTPWDALAVLGLAYSPPLSVALMGSALDHYNLIPFGGF